MTTLEEFLKGFYFKPGHSAAFSGPKKVFDFVRTQGYHPTFSYVKNWVKNQETYSLHRPSRKKFPRHQVVSRGVRHLYDMDLAILADLSTYNDGVTNLLVIIDTFTRYLTVRSLKSKTAKEVKAAVEDALESAKYPKIVRTDAGTEFCNKILNAFLKGKNVYHQVTRNEGHANYAERVIRTLKSLIMRFLTQNNTRRYIDVLQSLVKTYNNTLHSSIGMKPREVTIEKAKTLWWTLYKPKKPFSFKPFHMQVGDTVRIAYLKQVFTRDYDQHWSGEVFTVYKRYRRGGIPFYEIKDFNGEAIKGSFYTEELQKIVVDPDQLWKVEKVLKTRKRKGRTDFFVRWLHWPERFDSWVSGDSITDL